MPENILVVEYEPRYTDRVKQALTGQPYLPSFARDGEEAIRALDAAVPRLIVLSSVVPKISTSDLIRAIRERKALAATPILLTVSGYAGRAPKEDAERMGASDILPKPYSETEFLGKVNEMLGPGQAPLTSNDIFGELLEDEKHPTARRAMNPTDDVEKLLEQTLSGMMPRRKDPHAAPTSPGTVPLPKVTIPASDAKPKTHGGSSQFDKLVEDTLSGLERKQRVVKTPTSSGAPHPEPAAAVATPPPAMTEKVLLSQPIVTPKPAPAPPVPEEEPTDGIKYGQYVLLDRIATGGMAEVWKARMRGVEGFQKIVAIKKILPHLSDNQDFIEMFIDEAKLAAQLNHSNIIHIYDLGKTQGTYFIAMEYVDGHDLKTILMRGHDRDQPLGVELSLFIASKVAAALDYAHRRRDFEDKELSLVHRDVSPQNVLISQEGDLKLCDFGIAKAASKASHTQAGALKGKLQYMSPEQAWGKLIDRRSDIFALATVLFEMLTGRKLFAGDNEISVLEQVREARVTPPSQINDEVTPQIDAIVLKALHKEPAQRYQTAGEMARDIDSVLYNMRPTPTSADLAIYMHRIWIEEPLHAVSSDAPPTLIDQPIPAAAPAPAPAAPHPPARPAAAVTTPAPAVAAAAMPPWEAPAKTKSIVPIAIAAALVLGIGIGVIVMLRGRAGATQAPAAVMKPRPSTANIAPGPAPATTSAAANPAATQTIVPYATDTTATSTQAPAIDQAQVDAEVQKRIAAERARLEEQSRALQQPQPAPATPPRPAPVVTATQAAVQPAPAPVTQTIPPPPPAPATTSVADTPAPQPAPQRAREGDLVEAGTEGLTPAHITRQAQATYPPIARIQRIEGSIVVNVLVSENGQVLDTRVVSGAGRSTLLNDAAQQTVRRSAFAPGMKDGVHVKSWTMVRIDFKL